MQLFENLESDGAKKSKYKKNAFKVVKMKSLAMHISYYYGRKFTKYIHGTWSLLNIIMFSA